MWYGIHQLIRRNKTPQALAPVWTEYAGMQGEHCSSVSQHAICLDYPQVKVAMHQASDAARYQEQAPSTKMHTRISDLTDATVCQYRRP